MLPRRIAVLGSGRVGALIARDLTADPDITVVAVDRSLPPLDALAAAGAEARVADLSDPYAVGETVADADAVVVAVPGAIGHSLLEALIEAGHPIVDISFSAEDPWDLDEPARRSGIPVVVDCGVAPGISNLLVGRTAAELDEVESVRVLVGGLPVHRVPPWEYRVTWSPADVLEEYVRPCRIRRGGTEVVVPALSEVELIEFPEIGTLEAFFTDGLRTLLHTLPAPELVEKTLRWPGHAALARALRDSGFFDTTPIRAGDVEVTPRSAAEAVLAREWALDPGEEEFTLLRVDIVGTRGGQRERTTWDLLDWTDRATGATSMARTSGFPAAIVARLLAAGRVTETGVLPPELLARDTELATTILDELASRGVTIRREVELLD
jgi:saccharopine dehydrogenase-like NADP-dependent oxidoreductase